MADLIDVGEVAKLGVPQTGDPRPEAGEPTLLGHLAQPFLEQGAVVGSDRPQLGDGVVSENNRDAG
jgi:hypothetical protein